MQRLGFLPRRPAILVPSVLLTATQMCVTQPPPVPAVLHLLCHIPLHLCLRDTSCEVNREVNTPDYT